MVERDVVLVSVPSTERRSWRAARSRPALQSRWSPMDWSGRD